VAHPEALAGKDEGGPTDGCAKAGEGEGAAHGRQGVGGSWKLIEARMKEGRLLKMGTRVGRLGGGDAWSGNSWRVSEAAHSPRGWRARLSNRGIPR